MNEHEEQTSEIEREERRLERLRLISVITFPQARDEDEDEPQPAA
jgi:hypothetical protein